MKMVLVITFHFLKKEAIGSIRLRGLANHLPDFGWKPIILTPQSERISNTESSCKIIETQYEDITTIWKKWLGFNTQKTVKKQLGMPTLKNRNLLIDYVLKAWQEIFAYPDFNIGWYKYAVKAGERLLEEVKSDAILSSSSPPTCHLIAKNLKDKYCLPWVADCRDLWTQNHYYKSSHIRKKFETRLEQFTFKNANALTTVSQPLADKLKMLHRNKIIYTITNGFDLNNKNPGVPLSDKFNITYTGSIYKGKQDPEPLLRALNELFLEKKIDIRDVKVDFYGYDDGWLINDIKNYGLECIVDVYGMVTREESLLKQREAQLLLLLNWNDPQEKGIYTGKIFDYLAAQRPILSIGRCGGVVEDLLEQTKAGVHVSSIDDLKSIIFKLYMEYKATGSVSYHGITSEINGYSHREMARKFAEVLDRSKRI